MAFELPLARRVHRTQDGDGLRAEGDEGDGNSGVAQFVDERGAGGIFEFRRGETLRMQPTDDGEGDLAGGIDAESFVRKFFSEVFNEDRDLVVGAEEVTAGGGWRQGRKFLVGCAEECGGSICQAFLSCEAAESVNKSAIARAVRNRDIDLNSCEMRLKAGTV